MPLARPKEPRFRKSDAKRFRTTFRALCDFYAATNEDVGKALDAHSPLRGRWAEQEGPKAVANAMTHARPLTHLVARRLVAALFLSEPVRRDWEQCRDKPGLQQLHVANYESAYSFLVDCGAVQIQRPPFLPVFVPPAVMNEFAAKLARVIAGSSGVGKTEQRIHTAIAGWLRADGPLMARAWGDAARAQVARGDSDVGLIEEMLRQAFGDGYVYVSQARSEPLEFALLHSERPELVAQGLKIRRSMRRKS